MIKIRETDPMEYQEGMEKIDHSIMNKVLAMAFSYTHLDVYKRQVPWLIFSY